MGRVSLTDGTSSHSLSSAGTGAALLAGAAASGGAFCRRSLSFLGAVSAGTGVGKPPGGNKGGSLELSSVR